MIEAPRTVPFALPDIDEDDIAAVVEVLRSGWITTGPMVQQFEQDFSRRLGVRHAVALNSATAALHLALAAIDLQPGDEVILPTMTFTASAEVVRYFDATPVLADVLPDTLCLDPEQVERFITPRTRAVMPVHLGGHPAPMDAIMALARRRGLRVIEDAAHALPCRYHGQEAGTIGDAGAYSFYATKTITTGEGGMLVTDDDALAARARTLSLHGMSRDAWKRYTPSGSWRYDVVAPGFKYNLTDIAAALGVSQLRRADRFWERRASIAARYTAAFSHLPELEPPTAWPDVLHSWHLYAPRLRPGALSIGRDAFLEELAQLGVRTSVHFIPLHRFTYYREMYGLNDRQFPVATDAFERIFSLPIYPRMSESDVDAVIAAVTATVERFRP